MLISYKFSNDFLDAFDQLWYGTSSANVSSTFTEDIKDDGTWLVTLEVPGCKSKDVQITYDSGIVRVKAKKGSHEIERAIVVKRGYDPQTASAHVEDGILTLMMKQKESARPKVIPVLDASNRHIE